MPIDLAAKIPSILRSRLGLTLFAIVGVGATLLGYSALRQADAEVIARDFESRQELRTASLQQSLNEYENALFALRLVAENNTLLLPQEFERAARAIQARSPGIHCIQWVPDLAPDQMPDYLLRTRQLVDSGFTVSQRQPDGSLAPISDFTTATNNLAVITYATPRGGNENVIGYDINTGPTREDLKNARGSGAMTLTPPVPLMQGFEGVVLTCYARRGDGPDGPPLTGSGYVQLVLHLNQVLQSLWNRGRSDYADFALHDVTRSSATPLYTQLAGRAGPGPHGKLDDFVTPATISRDLKFAGRTWRASYRPAASWVAARRSTAPTLLLAGGLLLTTVGVAYLRQLLIRTERIRSEVAKRTVELSDSRAFLDTLIRQTPSALWVKDADLRYSLVNEEFCRTYGLTPADIIGRRISYLMSEVDAAEAERADREILSTGRTIYYEGTYDIKGQMRTYLVAKFPLRDVQGAIHAVGGVATDVTDRRMAELEKARIERRLLETQKLESLGVLAGGIAHDFNNLLTGILGHASLCRLMQPPTSPTQDSLGQIEHAARRAAELCQQMLAYSGRGRFVVEAVELGDLVRDTLPLLNLSLAKRARLDCEFAGNLPPVEADLTQLRQIVMNLVMNASEAFGENTGVITVRTRLVQATRALFASCVHSPDLPPGDYVCLEVGDNGCGMSADTLARIFDPFFTTKFTGRGLGLAAVLGIARGHHGALRVVSAIGVGSTFYLYLPVAAPAPAERVDAPPPPDQETPAASEAKSPPNDHTPKRRLLLVDDDASVRDIAGCILVSLGYEVHNAGDGREALERFRTDPARYDAAIIDLTMPGLSARELLAALRELHADLPVLVTSGYSETDAAALLTTEHTAFLPKPFSVSALREKLDALLAKT